MVLICGIGIVVVTYSDGYELYTCEGVFDNTIGRIQLILVRMCVCEYTSKCSNTLTQSDAS